MKTLRLFLTWPAIFATAYYFFSFQIAAIIGLAYLHVIIVLLFCQMEKLKDKLVEIVAYIAKKDGLIDPQTIVDHSTIETADDAIDAIISLGKHTKSRKTPEGSGT